MTNLLPYSPTLRQNQQTPLTSSQCDNNEINTANSINALVAVSSSMIGNTYTSLASIQAAKTDNTLPQGVYLTPGSGNGLNITVKGNGSSAALFGSGSYATYAALLADSVSGNLPIGAYYALDTGLEYGWNGATLSPVGGVPNPLVASIIPRTDILANLETLSNTANPGEITTALENSTGNPVAILQVGYNALNYAVYFPTPLQYGNFNATNAGLAIKTSIQQVTSGSAQGTVANPSLVVGACSVALVQSHVYTDNSYGVGFGAIIGPPLSAMGSHLNFSLGQDPTFNGVSLVGGISGNACIGVSCVASGLGSNSVTGLRSVAGCSIVDYSGAATLAYNSITITGFNWLQQIELSAEYGIFDPNTGVSYTADGFGTVTFTGGNTIIPVAAVRRLSDGNVLTSGDAAIAGCTVFNGFNLNNISAADASGTGGHAYITNMHAHGGGSGNPGSSSVNAQMLYGVNQETSTVFAGQTTTNTANSVTMTSDGALPLVGRVSANNPVAGSSNQLIVFNNKSYMVELKVVCKKVGTDDAMLMAFAGVVVNNGGTLTWTPVASGVLPTTYTSSDAATVLSGAALAITANQTKKCLDFKLTGIAGATLNWTARVITIEVSD